MRLLITTTGLVALAPGLGTIRPRLDWTDPRRSVSLGHSLGFLGLGSAYLAVCFTVLALPYAHPGAEPAGVTVADGGVLLLAGVTAWVALRAGVARLRSIDL